VTDLRKDVSKLEQNNREALRAIAKRSRDVRTQAVRETHKWIESFRKDMGELVTEIHRERVDSARRQANARREFVQGLTRATGATPRSHGRSATRAAGVTPPAEPPARITLRAEPETRESPAQRARKKNRAA
jgi:hypothetical protein